MNLQSGQESKVLSTALDTEKTTLLPTVATDPRQTSTLYEGEFHIIFYYLWYLLKYLLKLQE